MVNREFRVRPVVRYVVTEWDATGSVALGEFDNAKSANLVAITFAARALDADKEREERICFFTAPEFRIHSDGYPDHPGPTTWHLNYE